MVEDYRGALTAIQNTLDSYTQNLTPVKIPPTKLANERTFQPSRKCRLSNSPSSRSSISNGEDNYLQIKDRLRNNPKKPMTQIASKKVPIKKITKASTKSAKSVKSQPKKRDRKVESKVKGKNPKEEEKKGELPLNTQDMLQVQASLSRVDFANALYYFHPRESDLFMVHYNPEVTDNYFWS
jgi:hypothetical protein